MTVPFHDDPTRDGPTRDGLAYDGLAHDDAPAEDFDTAFFALELELLELACVEEATVLRTRLPEVGETLVAAFVPLRTDQEIDGRRAVLAACERRLPWVLSHAVAVDSIPRGADGAPRRALLTDRLLPQIARDLLSPMEMSD